MAPKKRLAVLIKVTASFVAFLLLAEGAARLLFSPPVYYAPLIDDAIAGFRMRPHRVTTSRYDLGEFSYRLNSHGFRGPELPARAKDDDGAHRLMFLGDSYLGAWAVREEWLLTNRVAETLGRERLSKR